MTMLQQQQVFARAKYFLERVIPVAEAYKIQVWFWFKTMNFVLKMMNFALKMMNFDDHQMACHLDDPPGAILLQF